MPILLLAEVSPPSVRNWTLNNVINKRIAAEYSIAYIDITPISRTGLDHPSLLAIDGLHPSAAQYKEWIEMILPYLELMGTADP